MTNEAPRIFISYGVRDVVLARLLVHIFEENGVECFLAERDLSTGCLFDSEISKQIRQSNMLIVLWSSDSASSPWVNQEVGMALAQNIPVWPIAIEEINIQGAIFRNQGSYLTRHEDPYSHIAKLAQEIKSTQPPMYGSFKPAIDQYMIGNVARTERIVELLQEEFSNKKDTYTLRMQAAFSCFAISDDPSYRVGGYHTLEYHALLVKELQGVERILRQGSLKAILWPRRPYDDRFIAVRFKNLIHFLETNRDFDKVRFVIGQYEGGNLYIFNSNVLVEGIKLPGSSAPGYGLTTVSYHRPTILSAISSFDERFDELWEDHAKACEVDPNRAAKSIRLYVIQELRHLVGQV
jgi:hypothetical protein